MVNTPLNYCSAHVSDGKENHKQDDETWLWQIPSVLLFRLMISFTENPSSFVWEGYLYAVVLFVVALLQSLFLQQYFQQCFVLGMKVRTAIMAAVYKKVKARVISREPFHTGKKKRKTGFLSCFSHPFATLFPPLISTDCHHCGLSKNSSNILSIFLSS